MKNIDFRNGQPLIMMVSQYDFGYNLQVALWSNGEPVTITAAEIVSENFTTTCTFSGNVVTIPVTTSMTERFGHFPAELRVTDSLGQVSSKNFDWFVERSPLAVKRTETYSGDIVEFTAKRVPLSSVVVTMEPIQDLNGYSSPWPAGGGKNKLDIDNRNSSSSDQILVFNCSFDAGTYTISATVESTSPSKTCLVLLVYEDNTNSEKVYLSNNTWSSVTITATKKVTKVRFYSATNYDTSQNYTIQLSNAQIESGSTATAWEPYSNVCPISGRTGASVVVGENILPNIAQSVTRNGVTFTVGEDGTITANGTATATTVLILTNADNPVRITANQQYWLIGCPQGGSATTYELMLIQNSEGGGGLAHDYGNGASYSVTQNVIRGVQIVIRNGYTANNLIFKPRFLSATTYPITFTSAGTVYAGTVDLVSGVLTVTHELATYDGTTGTFTQNGSDIIALNVGQTRWQNVGSGYVPLSNQFKGIAPGASTGLSAGEMRYTLNFVNMNFRFGSDKTVAQWKTELAQQPLQVLHLLATPLTYNLTPTQVMSLLGENVVWSPDGEILVVVPEYY